MIGEFDGVTSGAGKRGRVNIAACIPTESVIFTHLSSFDPLPCIKPRRWAQCTDRSSSEVHFGSFKSYTKIKCPLEVTVAVISRTASCIANEEGRFTVFKDRQRAGLSELCVQTTFRGREAHRWSFPAVDTQLRLVQTSLHLVS